MNFSYQKIQQLLDINKELYARIEQLENEAKLRSYCMNNSHSVELIFARGKNLTLKKKIEEKDKEIARITELKNDVVLAHDKIVRTVKDKELQIKLLESNVKALEKDVSVQASYANELRRYLDKANDDIERLNARIAINNGSEDKRKLDEISKIINPKADQLQIEVMVEGGWVKATLISKVADGVTYSYPHSVKRYYTTKWRECVA